MSWCATAAAALLLAIGSPAPASPAHRDRTTLQVFAAASLSEAFTEVAKELEQKRPDFQVRLNFAGSQQLAAQIEQGARADVYASADERWMGRLERHDLLAAEPVDFATNRLVVIVPKANPAKIERLQDLARRGIKLVMGADAVPVGRYGRTILRNLAHDPAFRTDFAARVLLNVVSEEESVKSVVGKVHLGEADAGIVYHSDVTASVARSLRVFEIPDSANAVASYPIAVVHGTRAPDIARAFVEFVLSSAGQAILERHGLTPLALASP